MSVKKRKLRKRGGAAIIGLVIAIMFFVLFLGLFAFDANRAQMCQRELIGACDAASITGTAMLASYDTSPNGQVSLFNAQALAGGYAINMFKRQVVLGQGLGNTTLVNSLTGLQSCTTPRQCNLMIVLGDPNNNFQAIPYQGDPAGRTVEVYTCYGYQPDFLSLVPFGMKVTPMSAASFGGLPQVDAVVVFDFSGSMDDFTSVLFVRREWYWPPQGSKLGNLGMPLYSVVTGASSGTNNLFSNYLRWNYTIQPAGSGTNVLPPQNIQAVGSGNTAVGNPLTYTNALRANPIFCPQWMGQNCMNAGGNTGDTVHFMPFMSPGNKAITLNNYDYSSPPGNYKPAFVYQNTTPGFTQTDYLGRTMISGVTSLNPDSPLSDPNQTKDAYHTVAGDGHPSFWWNHRSNTNTNNTPNVSGVIGQPSSILLSVKSSQAQYVGNSTSAITTATDYEPNAWGVSLYTQASSTATYHSGYPPQYSNGISNVNNSPYLAIANDMQQDNLFFTDLVVNIIDPTSGGAEYVSQPIPAINANTIQNFFFTGFAMTFPADEPDLRLAGTAFNFQNLATVVEAARGNLDLSANYTNACLDGNVIVRPFTSAAQGAASVLSNPPATVQVINGAGAVSPYWQLAYERVAMLESQPYATACDGAENGFFYKLSTLADCRFGFVGFSAVRDFSGTTATAADSYGASYANCLKGYPSSSTNDGSQGTATANSHLHSGIQYYYQNTLGYYYNSTYYNSTAGGVHPCNECWWRQVQNVTPTAGGSSYANYIAPTLNEQVYAFTAPATVGSAGGNAQGFKVPRTRLSTATPTGFTGTPPSQLCMVTSHASSASAVAPYNVTPWGDVWSSTARDGYANGVWNGRPMTDTYCDEALSTAYNYFSNSTNASYTPGLRLAARKTIVFFTDGEPTGGIGGSTSGNSNTVANTCNSHQIALFTIGLNMDPANNGTLTAAQYQFLGDGVNASYSGSQNGLAFYASNGSRFFQCQDGASVRSAFASIARRLSQAQM
jgi:hypothetical protein